MSEPDDSLEILIKMTADTAGGKEATQALRDVKAEIKDGVDPALAHYAEQTKAAAGGAEHMDITHRNLRAGLRLLGPEFAEAGHLGMAAFANPMTAGLIGLALALKGVDMLMKSMIEKDTSKIGAQSLAPGLADVAKVATDAKVALDDFFRTLHDGASAEEELGNQTQRATELAAAQAAAAAGAADAQKQMDLAMLEKARAEGKLTESQYKGAKIGIEEAAEMRKLDREKAERDASIKRHHDEIQAQQKLADEDAAKVPEARAQADSTRLAVEANERRIKAAKANEKSYAETNPEDMTPALKEARERNKNLLETFQSNQAGLQEAANAAKDALGKLESEAKTAQHKAQTEHAKVEAEEEVNRIKMAADENNLRTRFEAHRIIVEARSQEEALKSPEGKLFGDVSIAERTLQQTGHISFEQAAKIARAAEVLKGAHIAHGETILRALGSLAASTVENRKRIAELVKQVVNQGRP